MAPTYYVEDYDGERNDDDASPQVTAKVVEPETKKTPAKKTSAAKTKG